MSKWTCSHCQAINPNGAFKCHNCPNVSGDEYWYLTNESTGRPNYMTTQAPKFPDRIRIGEKYIGEMAGKTIYHAEGSEVYLSQKEHEHILQEELDRWTHARDLEVERLHQGWQEEFQRLLKEARAQVWEEAAERFNPAGAYGDGDIHDDFLKKAAEIRGQRGE